MIKEAKLILDNNAHKCSVTIDGKQQKITIAPFNEMSLTEAHSIIRQTNEILTAGFNFIQILKMVEVAENVVSASRYSLKALHIVIKLQFQQDWQNYIDLKQTKKDHKDLKRTFTLLNTGCTTVGKTTWNLYAIIPLNYVKSFLSLSSIKESTNFPIRYIVNAYDKKLKDQEEYEIEFNLKTTKEIEEDIYSLVLEALQEILDSIKDAVKANTDNSSVWEIAINAGRERLRVNKNKTFDITTSVILENEGFVLEQILLKSLKEYSTRSSSYTEKLVDEQMKNDIVNDTRNNIFKLSIDEIAYAIYETTEFKDLTGEILNQLHKLLNRFSLEYEVELIEKQPIIIRKLFNDGLTKKLISNIFGDKKQRSDKDFFSIDALLSEAKIYFKNTSINNGNQLIIVDGLGINQGQIPKGTEKQVAYNRVHAAIQQCNPDLIVYHTRLDAKDDYMIDVIKDLNEQGYKNRVFVVYGRLDTVMESYCDEEDIEIKTLDEEQLGTFKDYIDKEYINKEVISLGNLGQDKIYLCDKSCKLLKYPLDEFAKFTPEQVLMNIIDTFRMTEKAEMFSLNKEKVNKIIETMNDRFIFNDAFNEFRVNINNMVPMNYHLLRWNTLECAIRNLYYDGQGYGCLYPSITLKNCFARYLNCDELKELLGGEYDDVLKELLNQWTNLAHILMITSYRLDFSQLLAMRYEYSLRTMTSMTLTDERKHVMRNILSTCFKDGDSDGPSVFRKITKYVLANVVY